MRQKASVKQIVSYIRTLLCIISLFPIEHATAQLEVQQPDTLIGYYNEIPLKTFVGARTTLQSKQLNTTPANSYLPAMTGRLPGFYTQQHSGFRETSTTRNYESGILGNVPLAGQGVPSENTEYSIALRRQIPVVIVDGVQRDIFSIDPDNIESITLLKDALSTIELGQRSSRGILLVTTKRPEIGKTKINFRAQLALQEPLAWPEPIPSYQFAYLLNEAMTNVGNQPVYAADDFNAFRAGNDPYRYPNVNWYDEVFRSNAPMMRYNLSAKGGNAVSQYAIALNYTDQQGLFKEDPHVAYNTNASLKRYMLNTNVNINITPKFKLGLQMTGRIQDGNEPGIGTQNVLENVKKTPNGAYPVRNADGSWASTNYFQTNVVALATHSGYRQDNMKDIMANINLNYDLGNLLKGLKARAMTNIAVQSLTGIVRQRGEPTYNMGITPAGDTVYNIMAKASAQTNDFNTVFNARFWFTQLALDYDKSWSNNHIVATVQADQRRTLYNFDLPAVATNATTKLVYDYEGKYLAHAALNASGFNRYRPGYQYGLFYAFGLGWVASEEDFIKHNAPWINHLKLRGVFGKTGSGVDNAGYYDYRATFTASNGGIGSGAYAAGSSRSELRGFWENGFLPNIRTWEGAYKLNVGVDLSLFDGKIDFTGDVYYDQYYDLLQSRGKSIELIGISYPDENIGRSDVKGAEFNLAYRGGRGDFQYFIAPNLTIEQTKLSYFDEQRQRFPWQQMTGLPLGVRMGYVADDIIQNQQEAEAAASTIGYELAPGDIRYRDLNGDGIINQFDRTAISTTKPLIYYGINLGFSYKGLSFSTLIQGVGNRDLYLDDRAIHGGFLGFGGFEQAYPAILDRWTPETAATATYPRLTIGNSHNYAESSFWIRSGNYVRLKNVQLAYSFSPQWMNKMRLSGLTVFANAMNLATWSAFDGQDPEVAIGAYPIQRVINFGLNLNL
ncbi:SusC/RagA family TonB-linked outer membrane protein [Sphingobacterium griseoflavum]|uniref:SusC/RagA family TonB-linked outer membrane protein n=1 Tax=Sphingobacterium griseoflavum TaxID=1474952 RepID=A0ABQ3HUE9_9SPHI|nr:SusC/RagA family TonB-linked outer membrane protein [Sphingobacterium griseoflavum]GHE35728.1 SusC/RagA family TonB-linked outer membrane protein [Sphingobacterium griseoflavum]